MHVVHGLHRLHHFCRYVGGKVIQRTWYTDCVFNLILFNGHDYIALRTWYTDCIGKHAQILLHIRRRFYLIVLILADVR